MRQLHMVIAALLLSAQPAMAEDYPFSGFVAAVGEAQSSPQSDVAKCALSFINQKPDGSYVGYHVDMENFRKIKTVRYVTHMAGTCAYDKARRIEACSVSTATATELQGKTFYDTIESIGPAYVKTIAFDTKEEALASSVSGEKGKGFPVTFFRCPFDEAPMATMISTAISDLTSDELGKLTFPDAQLLNDPLTAELVKAVGLKAAE